MLVFLVSVRDYWSLSLPLAFVGLLLAWGLGSRADAARPRVVEAPTVERGLQEVLTPHAV
jgi:hypothetical protein